MKQLFISAFLMCAVAGLTGCATHQAQNIQGKWMIRSAKGTNTSQAETAPFIEFGQDGHVHGNAAVNSFSGSYALKGESLTLNNIGMTMMMGPHMEIESAVANALNETSYIKAKGDSANVYDRNRNPIMVLVRPAQ